MYVTTQPNEVLERADDETTSGCHFWCNMTLTGVGPDDQPVHKESCRQGRACFEE